MFTRLSWKSQKTISDADQQTPGSQTSKVNDQAFGLKEIEPGINPVLDIVAIHGLNGHRDNTWMAEKGVNWLRDLLPKNITNARILSYGYDARTHGFVSQQYIHDHGTGLLTELSLTRRATNTEKRPIVFIAHSLGGIVCKIALILASAANESHLNMYKEIHLSTYGILFFGTPHQGGNGVSLGKFLVNVASIFTDTNKKLLKHLKMHSEWLLQQTAHYNAISSHFETKYFYETYKTPTPFGAKIIVPKYSAVVPGAINAEEIAINRNHLEMVRFHSNEDECFKKISQILDIMASEAVLRIGNKWQQYDARNDWEPKGVFHSSARTSAADHETPRMKSIEYPQAPITGHAIPMGRIFEDTISVRNLSSDDNEPEKPKAGRRKPEYNN